VRGGTTGGSPEAIVVGGGFAGLAAATALAEEGARVVLMEARPHLGGRARSWIDPETGHVVDNGQHLFMGCYAETLRFLSRIGALERLALQPRLQVPFLDPGGRSAVFRLPRLPSPWNLAAGLLRCPGLSLSDRLSLLRVGREVARRSRRVAAPGSAGSLDDRSVAEWLAGLGQSPEATRRLWFPLAVAALNEDPRVASAACFLPVLREAFHRGAAGSRLGIARVGLSDLYVDPALHFLRGKGCEARTRTQVRRLLVEGGRFGGVLMPDGTRVAAGAVVAAVPPEELLELLPPGVAADPAFAGASRLQTSPIVSAYLWFGSPVTDLPFAGLIGGTWQWMFNRRAFAGSPGGQHGVTLVCSAARDLVDRPREQLVRLALEDLHAFVPASRRAALRHSLVIKEKRATISPARGALALRPASRTRYRGLHLAGDWIATGLPATIEGAVLSGHACARQVLDER
jgi:squalene-associated FAD-dependent desaturase